MSASSSQRLQPVAITTGDTAALALVSALHRAIAPRKASAADAEHAKNVKAALDRLLELGSGASVKADQDERLVIVNEKALPVKSHARPIEGLVAQFAATGISEIRFARALTDDETAKLLPVLRRKKDAPDPFAACRKTLEGLWSTGLRGTVDIISLEQLGHKVARTVKVDAGLRARLVYAKVLAVFADYLANEGSDELHRTFGWKLMKTIHALVDLALEDEKRVLALAQVRGADAYVVNHAANTAALSILVGKRLGLPRSLLVQLGYAALLHGCGKLRTAPAIVNKPPAQRSPEEAREFARHPYRGVGVLLEERRLDDPVVTSALVAFQYEARKGFPAMRKLLGEVHPLSQIVGLCRVFAACLASGSLSPVEAFAAATKDPLRPCDPVVVHVLGSFVGALAAPVAS